MGVTFSNEQFQQIMNGLGMNSANGGVFYGSVPSQMGGFNGIGGGEMSGAYDRFANANISKLRKEIAAIDAQAKKDIMALAKKNNWSQERIDKELQNRKATDTYRSRKVKELNKVTKEANGTSYAITFFKRMLALAKAYQNKEFTLYREQIATTQKLTEEQINLSSQSFQGSFTTVLNTLNGNVRDIGKSALSTQMKMSKSFWAYERRVPLEMRKLANSRQIAEERFNVITMANHNANMVADAATLGAQNKGANRARDAALAGADYSQYLNVSKEDAEMYRNEANLVKDMSSIAGDLIDMREEAMKIDTETREILNTIAGKVFDEVNEVVEKFSEIAQVTTNTLLDIDKGAKRLALNFGFTGAQAQAMATSFINSNLAAAKWGMKAEDFMAMQNGYMDTAGRQVTLNDNDFDKIAATSRITGMNPQEIGSIVGEMNVFNTSVDHATSNIETMYKLANKMGLSSKQFMKDLNQNLKLAQKYNFVGGTKAMERMTIWAQQVRMNLASATSFAESLNSGGIENTLQKAAQLQVLGGNAAIYSDPLGMMYDARADTESLARRMEAMLGNFGTFNAKTGETDFSWTDDMMIEQVAKAMGMDKGEAKNILREKNKFSTIRKEFTGNTFTEDEQRTISNRATYDEKTGKFKVTVLGANGEKLEKNVGDLTPADYANMIPQDNEEALVDFAQKSFDVEMKQLAVTRAIAAQIGVNTQGDFYKTQAEKEEILRAYGQEQVVYGTQSYASIANQQNQALKNEYESAKAAWNSGLISNSLAWTSEQMTHNVERITNLNKEFQQVTRMLVGDEKELYAAAIKFAELTGNTELIESMKRNQTNKADDDAAVAAGKKPNWLGQYFSFLRPGKTDGAYGYENHMSYQNYKSYGGHAFDGRYEALPKATDIAFNKLTTALNNFSTKPIQTNSTISLNGTLNLQQPSYGATNLISELQKNPALLNQFINLMASQTSINANGGKEWGSVPGAPR